MDMPLQLHHPGLVCTDLEQRSSLLPEPPNLSRFRLEFPSKKQLYAIHHQPEGVSGQTRCSPISEGVLGFFSFWVPITTRSFTPRGAELQGRPRAFAFQVASAGSVVPWILVVNQDRHLQTSASSSARQNQYRETLQERVHVHIQLVCTAPIVHMSTKAQLPLPVSSCRIDILLSNPWPKTKCVHGQVQAINMVEEGSGVRHRFLVWLHPQPDCYSHRQDTAWTNPYSNGEITQDLVCMGKPCLLRTVSQPKLSAGEGPSTKGFQDIQYAQVVVISATPCFWEPREKRFAIGHRSPSIMAQAPFEENPIRWRDVGNEICAHTSAGVPWIVGKRTRRWYSLLGGAACWKKPSRSRGTGEEPIERTRRCEGCCFDRHKRQRVPAAEESLLDVERNVWQAWRLLVVHASRRRCVHTIAQVAGVAGTAWSNHASLHWSFRTWAGPGPFQAGLGRSILHGWTRSDLQVGCFLFLLHLKYFSPFDIVQGHSQPRMNMLCRWGSGGRGAPSGLNFSGLRPKPEKFLKGSIFDARNKQFHQFHKPSSFSLIDVLLLIDVT